MPGCSVGPEDRTGVVKSFALLGLEQKRAFIKGFPLDYKDCHGRAA